MLRWARRNHATRAAIRDLRRLLEKYKNTLAAFRRRPQSRFADEVVLALCDIVSAQAHAVLHLERRGTSGTTLGANVRAGFEAALFACFIATSDSYEADAVALYVFDEFEHADYMAKYTAAFSEDLPENPAGARTRDDFSNMVAGFLHGFADHIEDRQPAAAALMRERAAHYAHLCKGKKLRNDPFGGMRAIRDALEARLPTVDLEAPSDHSAKLEMIYSLLSSHAHPRPRLGNPVWRADNPSKVRAEKERRIGEALHLTELALGYGEVALYCMERQAKPDVGAA